jgi:hypothetical protein
LFVVVCLNFFIHICLAVCTSSMVTNGSGVYSMTRQPVQKPIEKLLLKLISFF